MLMDNDQTQRRNRMAQINKSSGFQTLPQATIIENELFVKHTLDIEEVPTLKLSAENWKRIANRLYGTGCSSYDKEKEELRFVKFIGQSLEMDLLKKFDDNEFASYIATINGLIRKKDELLKKQVADQVQENKDFRILVEEMEQKVRMFLSEAREEKKQLAAQKSRPVRVYSDAEKAKNIHWQDFAEPDLVRSKENLIDKKLALKKQIKELDQKNAETDKLIWPLCDKVDELAKNLEADLTEDEFKNAKLSIEFHEAKIEKYRNQMMPFFEKVFDLNNEVEKIDNQLKLLDILIDKAVLLKNARINFPRRRERLLHRVHKLLKELSEIETLRENLNARWRDLTGDREDLAPALGLKSDSRVYFI